MTGTILLTGGTGKTSTRIATKLRSHNIPVLLASRGKTHSSGPAGFKTVRFDWFDETTYVNPFNEDKNIDTVYIIVPNPGVEAVAEVKKFIDLARQKGVGRFLLLSGYYIEKGSELYTHGQVHAYLETIGVDYAVLRPGRFFGNFLLMTPSIKANNELITAAGKGKSGFTSEDDIVDVAVDLLTGPKLGGAELIIFGPELLSFDDIAEQLSQVVGRKITHRSVSAAERTADFVKQGIPERVASILAANEAQRIAAGVDEKIYNRSGVLKGKTHFVEFANVNEGIW